MNAIQGILHSMLGRPLVRHARCPRREPPAIAQNMDADRVHAVLRSAEAGNMADFFSLARDITTGHGHTLSEFAKRKLAVVGPGHSVAPRNNDNPDDVAFAAAIGDHIDSITGWYDAMLHLLDSTLYPVALVEKRYKPSRRTGWRYELADLVPVPYHLLDYTTGVLRVQDTDPEGNILPTYHVPEPLRYIVHRGHPLASIPDTWGGPMRAVIFWWLFAVMDRDWWARFLDRFGTPFLEGTYNEGDDDSRMLLEAAFASASRLMGIAVPDGSRVQVHSVNTSQAGDAFERFHSVANAEISKIIVGQTLSADGQNLGFGGGQGKLQGSVRDDIRQFDATRLAHAVRAQIFSPLAAINGWTRPLPLISWGATDDEALETSGALLSSLFQAGLRVTDPGIEVLSRRLAIPLERLPSQPASAVPAPIQGQALASTGPVPGRIAASRSAAARSAVDSIAAAGAGGFAASMRALMAPLTDAVSMSSGLHDLEIRLQTIVPDLDLTTAADIALAALIASGATAAIMFRDPPE